MNVKLPQAKAQKSPLHFRRIEIKYLLPNREVPRFMDRIAPYVDQDPYLKNEGLGRTSYHVTSLYFDSTDYHSMFEKAAGLLSRRKVRLRTYHDTFSGAAPFFLEIKRRHDFVVSKDRLSIEQGCLHKNIHLPQLLQHMLSHVEKNKALATEAMLLSSWYSLQPTTLVRYHRIPFVAKEDSRFRITIDHELEGFWMPPHLELPRMHKCLPGRSIVELKFNHSVPAWFHNVIQDLTLERVANSKYSTVVRNLAPSLEQ